MDNSITGYQKIQPNDNNYIDAKELHQALGVKTYFTTWFNRVVKDYGFKANKDFFSNLKESQKGRPETVYEVTIGMAKEMCMTARGEIGRDIRQHYIKLEEALTKAPRQITVGEEAARFYNNLLAEVDKHSPTARITIAAKVSEQVFGVKVPYHALPAVTESRKGAEEIGEELGLSGIMVGKITKDLGLRSSPYAEKRLSVAKYTNKEVPMLHYSVEAQRLIKEEAIARNLI